MSERIGEGAWARLFASSVVPDEGASTAERGRSLARDGEVHSVEVREGVVAGRVFGTDSEEHAATISAEPVPERIWAAVASSARGHAALEASVEGREQSVHLEHLMTVDWEQPLVPPAAALARACTCAAPQVCEHVAALAFTVAAAVDDEPSLLLRWRGCVAAEPAPAAVEQVDAAPPENPWEAGALPPARPPRPFPVGAVLARLGPSGLAHAGGDLADVLARAYAAFAASDRR